MKSIDKDVAIGLAWLIALAASLRVIFIGEVLGQTPCLLCWFQRVFMFPLALILGFGLWWQDENIGRYGVVLSIGGACVAFWHVGPDYEFIPQPIQPCTATGPSCVDDNQLIFGIPIPLLAFTSFTLIGGLSAYSLQETKK